MVQQLQVKLWSRPVLTTVSALGVEGHDGGKCAIWQWKMVASAPSTALLQVPASATTPKTMWWQVRR